MKLNKLLQEYYLSYDFNNLRDETKVQYKYFLDVAINTEVGTAKTLAVSTFLISLQRLLSCVTKNGVKRHSYGKPCNVCYKNYF